jgi:predicted nucleic acid-binding protein
MYLLDTNVCIQFLNKSSQELTWKLIGTDPDEIFLCSIVMEKNSIELKV